VSSQTNYLIIGQDPGPSKLSLAKQHNTIIISEFEFLDAVELLRQSQGKSAKKVPEKPKFKQENELDSVIFLFICVFPLLIPAEAFL
jgi:BRCT domain type II-containing protein